MEFVHKPIMLNEILSGLNIRPDGIYIDCTIGGAGHSKEIVKSLNNQGRLIGIDKDQDALDVCKERLKEFKNVTLVKSDFKNIEKVLQELNIDAIDGVLIDLGVSSYQLDNPERGFSFRFDAKLDMRMDKSQELSAYTVVNTYSKQRLTRILAEYGEEEYATSIANNIVNNRPIETTKQLAAIIEKSMPTKVVFKRNGAHKKTFQAIRIEVNEELNNLFETVNFLISKLKRGGRMAVLTFHSLEDRIIKNSFKIHSTECLCPPKTPICICGHKKTVELVNKKPIIASESEQKENSRSTSAKLRIIEKCY
ncbi:MAG: 16S rRNA (cytosine(1402)-N(4))-methyltransferase RsmH [Clostridia bacterium]|nr:16S rRNA (cytosine(1402)-N(4))-methyltransferase RsmH [Clostridia bacterium]